MDAGNAGTAGGTAYPFGFDNDDYRGVKMSKHSEAVKHLVALTKYCINIENCDNCAIEEYCTCHMLTEAEIKRLETKAKELERQDSK